jgi:hypothetical protein
VAAAAAAVPGVSAGGVNVEERLFNTPMISKNSDLKEQRTQPDPEAGAG